MKIRSIKINNKSSENVAVFRYLGMAETDQNYIEVEVKHRTNSGNTCSVQFRIV
jgi:hypothetical protein